MMAKPKGKAVNRKMPLITGLIGGGLGAFGAWNGWFVDVGVEAGSGSWAIVVGLICFVIAALLGILVFELDL